MKKKLIFYSLMVLTIILLSMATAFMVAPVSEMDAPVAAMSPVVEGATLLEYTTVPADEVNVTAGITVGAILSAIVIIVGIARLRYRDILQVGINSSNKFYASVTRAFAILRYPLKFPT